MTGPVISPAGVAHAAVLAAVHAEAFDEPWAEDDLRALLADPGAAVVIAEDAAGEPTGFILCRRVVDEAEVLTIAVRPAWRRQGIAAALMRACGVRLADQGAATLFLEVAEDNAPARALYEILGFAPVGRRKGYYARPGAAPVDAFVLAADLPLDDD